MEKILFVAHTQPDGTLPNVAREALSAAVELSSKAERRHLIRRSDRPGSQAGRRQHCRMRSCSAFWPSPGAEFAVSRYASDAAAVEALVRQAEATLVVAPTTSRFSRALPGVVQRLQGRIETHVSGLDVVDGKPQIQRWYYRQRMVATQTRTQRPWFLVIDGGVFPAWQGEPGTAAWKTWRFNSVKTPSAPGHRRSGPLRQHPDHPPGGRRTLCRRRRLDQKTGRRPAPSQGGRGAHPRLPARTATPPSAAANRWSISRWKGKRCFPS